MTGDDEPLDLKLARKAFAEAEQLRKSAAADLEAAKDEHARAARCLRDTQELEKNLARREEALRKAGEPDFVRREQEAAKALADAKALMAAYSNDKHAAAIYLRQCSEREAAEQPVA